MNKHDKEIQDRLNAMPFTEARKAIKNGTLYNIGSPSHSVSLSWLEGKEAELREARELKMLRLTKIAIPIAIIAIIIATIAAREDIMWLISWLVSIIKILP